MLAFRALTFLSHTICSMVFLGWMLTAFCARWSHTLASDREKLINYIKFQSAKDVLPKRYFNESLVVRLDFHIERLHLSWVDEFITWDAERFNELREIKIPVQSVWHPDLQAINGGPTKMLIENSALITISWNPKADTTDMNIIFVTTVSLMCSNQWTKFPFDKTVCSSMFTSQTHSNDQLSVTCPNAVTLDREIENRLNWDLLSAKAWQEQITYHGLTKDAVVLEVQLKRRPLPYLMLYLVPVTSTALLSITAMFHMMRHSETRHFAVVVPTLSVTVVLLVVLSLPSLDVVNTGTYYGAYISSILVLISVSPVTLLVSLCSPKTVHKVTSAELCLGIDRPKPSKSRSNSGGFRDPIEEECLLAGVSRTADPQEKYLSSLTRVLQELRDIKFIANTTYSNHLECHRTKRRRCSLQLMICQTVLYCLVVMATLVYLLAVVG